MLVPDKRDQANSEIVERLPGSKLRGEPAWLFPATRPSLSKILRISVFGKYLRVGAAHATLASSIMALGNADTLTKSRFPAFTKCMADPRYIQTRPHFASQQPQSLPRAEFVVKIKNRTHPAMGRVMESFR